MRVTQRTLQDQYLYNLQRIQVSKSKYQTQITTQSMINKPSDSPIGNSRVLRLGSQLEAVSGYSRNVANSLPKVESAISAMGSMLSEIDNLISDLTTLNNPIEDESLDVYATKVDRVLDALLDQANAEFDGQYLFAGTDYSRKPFALNATDTSVDVAVSGISGEHMVKVSSNVNQKINITGEELLQVVVSNKGNIDSSAGVGVPQNISSSLYDADGNSYSFNVTYTMTGANTYTMDYELLDSSSVSVYNGSNTLEFNSVNGALISMDGGDPFKIDVNLPGNNIRFKFDTSELKEKAESAKIVNKINQSGDIFNTLISIRDNLLAGNRPQLNQVQTVQDFRKNLVAKMSEAGSIVNRLDSTSEMLSTQELELTRLISKEQDVDMALAVTNLQNEEYNLQLAYKVSSMILPKSLLDYL